MSNVGEVSETVERDPAIRRRKVIPDDHSFALCLTHDVDRPYKTYQSPYYAIRDRSLSQLRDMIFGRNPYWSFDRIRSIEAELGVRSAFYFLDEESLFTERPRRELLDPQAWSLYTGRYDIADPKIVDLIHELDDGGWEIGLHGSYNSFHDRERLREQKRRLESILGRAVTGGRQHHLNLSVPDTWEHHAAIGLQYDASLGSSTEYGFTHGYGVHRPFDDEFVVFPLTAMEIALPIEEDPDRAWEACEELLADAYENAAVMTVLWHPRFFCSDTPNYAPIYRRLIERALELGAWVGPPGELYDRLDHPDTSIATSPLQPELRTGPRGTNRN
ncbi:polysaccharide deacetylase family protein [Halorubrum sp. DTA98]|uniref:polysaccharide deacetylase family protein n=1 Tax=Halorubrum sp. DTA98 TaxID=3402163 RepID=UPI003AACDCC0